MDLPWPAITAASGGWLLFSLSMYGLLTGKWLVSRREADQYILRAEKAEANVELALQSMAAQTGVGKLQRKVLEAAAEATAESPSDPVDGGP